MKVVCTLTAAAMLAVLGCKTSSDSALKSSETSVSASGDLENYDDIFAVIPEDGTQVEIGDCKLNFSNGESEQILFAWKGQDAGVKGVRLPESLNKKVRWPPTGSASMDHLAHGSKQAASGGFVLTYDLPVVLGPNAAEGPQFSRSIIRVFVSADGKPAGLDVQTSVAKSPHTGIKNDSERTFSCGSNVP